MVTTRSVTSQIAPSWPVSYATLCFPVQTLDPKQSLQAMILALEQFWAARGCVIQQPYPSEVGAGTFNPATFLRALGPEPWRVSGTGVLSGIGTSAPCMC